MRLAVAVFVASVFWGAAAYAQIAGYYGGASGNNTGPGFIRNRLDFGMGLAGSVGTGGGGGGGCSAGQLNFADGCNTTFYVLGVT